MSLALKYIIPLLDNHLTKETISEKAGFVNAFTNDINKPYLDNHILLMYDFEASHTKELTNRAYIFAYKIKKKPFLHRINNKWYSIYALPIINGNARKYRTSGIPSFSESDRLKMINFWGTSDSDINKMITNPFTTLTTFEESTIAEEDYVEE